MKNDTCNLEIPGYRSELIFGTKSEKIQRGSVIAAEYLFISETR